MQQTPNLSDYQYTIYMQGLMGQRPELPVSMSELEARAKEVLPPEAFWYVAGGSGDDETVRNNRRGFEKWQIVPRMLRDLRERRHSIELFGKKFPAPIMLAPVGVQEIVHPEAERSVARAAAQVGMPMILSTLASTKLETVAELLGDTPRWFQLYWPKDPEITDSLIRRAETAGYSAIVITVDTRIMGWREHDLKHGYLPFIQGKGIANYTSDPVFCKALEESPEQNMQAAIGRWIEQYSDLAQTWKDLERVRKVTKLPILIKGLLHPEDALEAFKLGMDGVIVSNHGGRQSGGTISSIEALPAIVDVVAEKGPVLLDGGIRHGADVIKALALGAKAVLLGRPYIYGLALGGEAGVKEVLLRVLADYDITMACCGFITPEELNPSILVRS